MPEARRSKSLGLSLAGRLFALTLIALTPPILIQVWSGLHQRHAREASLRRRAIDQSRTAKATVANAVEGVRQLLIAMSEAPTVRRGDAVGCTAYLEAVAAQSRPYTLLGVNGSDGQIICSSAGVEPGTYTNADRAYHRRALAQDGFAAGDLVVGVTTHRRSIHFALPFRKEDGSTGGIVLASVDQGWLADQLAISAQPPGALAMVVDPAGTVVAGAEDGRPVVDGWVGQPLTADLRGALTVSAPIAVRAPGPLGRPRLFGALPADRALAGLTVAVGLDDTAALADLRTASLRDAAIVLFGGLTAFGASMLGARRFVLAPLARLSAAADRVGRGELGTLADLARDGREMRDMGDAFDRMSAALAARETDRMRAQAATHAAEDRYRTVFQSLDAGFCIIEVLFDADGRATDYRFLEVNRAFERQTGIVDGVGHLMREIAPEHEQHWFDIYGGVALSGEPVRFENEARALERWFDVHAFRVDAAEERHVAILFNDITERRRTELAVQELNATLEQRVEHEVAERGKAEEAFRQSQKMEAVGQLTGGVAHDFNNLLTILRSSTDLLRRPGLSEQRRDRYLDAMSDTVERAARLTGQLLAFARRQALTPEVFDVDERVRAVADMLDTVTGARIRVVVEAAERPPCFVKADGSQFDTSLVNMAVNARDAMADEGTLTLAVACGVALPPIRGHGGATGPFVAVSLADTGAGIAPDDLSRIFEPFFTTKGVGKGTGLGLSQVFGFAKQSGGDIDVASEPGEGTTFTLFLPQTEGAQPARRPPDAAGAIAGGGGRRILVVEDNLEIGRFATQILEDLDYRPDWVVNAADALARLAGGYERFDAVFTDVVMPGDMDGVGLAREIKRRRPDLPVVLTSGYSHVLAAEGPHGFELVHKPYSAEQVARALATAIADGTGEPPEDGLAG